MHIIICIDIFAEGPLQKEIEAEFAALLKGYSWVKALRNLYIVKLRAAEQREILRRQFVEVARKRKELKQRINLLISPVIIGGGYNGFLPLDRWEKVNQRTQEDA